jgi:hypothetical protein
MATTPIKPAPVVIQATPQPAQTVTLTLTADQATVLESARLNAVDATGKPLYPTVSAFVGTHALVKNLLRQLARQYPTAEIKAKQQASVAAQRAALAAQATAEQAVQSVA